MANILNPRNTVDNTFRTFDVEGHLIGPEGRIPAETLRRRFNMDDSVSKLTVNLTPFLTLLKMTKKKTTNDPQFKQRQYRENAILKRQIEVTTEIPVVSVLGGADQITLSADATDPSRDRTFAIPYSALKGGGLPKFIFPKLTFAWKTIYKNNADATDTPVKVVIHTARINSLDAGNSKLICTLTSNINEVVNIPAGTNLIITGSAWEEGSGAPDTWIDDLGSSYGQCQIFKTAADMSGSAMATEYAGWEDEWMRLWNMKMPEHNLDLERAFTFGTKYTDPTTKLRFTDGIASFVTRHPSSFGWTVKKSGFHYDDFLEMSEAMFDEGTGNSSNKVVLCGSSVLTYLNRIKNGFMDSTLGGATNGWLKADVQFDNRTSAFGHRITRLESVHGGLNFIKHPGFRGEFKNLAVILDLNHVYYRALEGNGNNRDTFVKTNVQPNDYDYRKDMIITEAGLQIDFPETHGFIYFADDAETPEESQVDTNLTNTEKAQSFLDNYGDIQGDAAYSDDLQG